MFIFLQERSNGRTEAGNGEDFAFVETADTNYTIIFLRIYNELNFTVDYLAVSDTAITNRETVGDTKTKGQTLQRTHRKTAD